MALRTIAGFASGDARYALNALESAAALLRGLGETRLTKEIAAEALQQRVLLYDKGGEQHYDLISALHKSVRNSDADAALYWLRRMLAAGEDAMYVARRLIRMAVEDIGLAAPEALNLCLSAQQAMHLLGSPEGELALAQATVYLALAPKSNAVYRAWGDVAADVEGTAAEPVPLHLRNAPTKLMKSCEFWARLSVRARCGKQSGGDGVLAALAGGTAILRAHRGRTRAATVSARLAEVRRLQGRE